MAPHTPRIPILLDERRLRIKRIAALRTEEMAHMPTTTTSEHDFSLNGCLAASTARREEFVVVQMTIEAEGGVTVVEGGFAGFFFRDVGVAGRSAGFDACEADGAGSVGLRVEGHAFEGCGAVMAGEAVGVETLGRGAYDAAFDWESAGGALGCRTAR